MTKLLHIKLLHLFAKIWNDLHKNVYTYITDMQDHAVNDNTY